MAGEPLTQAEGDAYTTYALLALGRLYKKYNVVMQIHYSCLRNVNKSMFRKLGPDTGYDMIAVTDGSASISSLLSALTETGECPKVILYSLNPADFDMLGTILAPSRTTKCRARSSWAAPGGSAIPTTACTSRCVPWPAWACWATSSAC